MSKYNKLKELKKTKANKEHLCDNCGKTIEQNTEYYKESLKDKFLQSLHAKKYCSDCYDKYGLKLLKMKRIRKISSKKVSTDELDLFSN